MPVEFLTDDAAAFGRYPGAPSDLDRVFSSMTMTSSWSSGSEGNTRGRGGGDALLDQRHPGCQRGELARITLWNTVCLDAILEQLRADGFPVLDADVARLSPCMYAHVNVHGHYTFTAPDLGGARRALRNLDAAADE